MRYMIGKENKNYLKLNNDIFEKYLNFSFIWIFEDSVTSSDSKIFKDTIDKNVDNS